MKPTATDKKAVLYLRVSSTAQTKTATDIDKDGNSIATQRDLTTQKAADLHAAVVSEFVEPGVSAQTITKRKKLKEMMIYLKENPGIDYVIIYARSRAFRNFTDAAITRRALEELGIRLISVRENFGEGIQAEAMEAITDIMNQMGNQLSGEDIRLKLRNKAMNGGTLGPARIGYLNIRKEVDGYLVNSIGVDPKRAPLVRQAFELYATGQYTLDRLHSELEDRGLRTRATPTRPSSPLSRSRLNGILKDPYYTGVVIYKGEVFPGRHKPIIPQDLFERVQEVMSERSGAGSREVTHLHYLRGILRCQRCHDRNIESRLLFTESKGRNGEKHQYYFCATRQRDKSCDLPFLPVWEVEDKIAPVFDEIAISEAFVADLNDKLDAALRSEHESVRESRLQLNKELASIVKRESRLIDAITEGLVTNEMAKAKMNELAVKKQGISRRLDKTVALLQQGVDVLRDLASLMLSPREHYEKAPDSYRRLAL